MPDTKRIDEALFGAASDVQRCVDEVTQMRNFLDKKKVAEPKNEGSMKLFTAQGTQDKNKKVLEALQNEVKNVQEVVDLSRDTASEVKPF